MPFSIKQNSEVLDHADLFLPELSISFHSKQVWKLPMLQEGENLSPTSIGNPLSFIYQP